MIKEINLNGELYASTYLALQNAIIDAQKDSSVKAILVHVNSTGGTVEALPETASLIKNSPKPVYVYTQTKMLSAAYWLASQAHHIWTSSFAKVGSIGAVAVHYDYSKNLEKDGIKVTILRSVEKKAVPSIYEPLDEQSKLQIQDKLDKLHRQFVNSVMEKRMIKIPESEWANGEIFDAPKALEIGLVDKIIEPALVKDTIQAELINSNQNQIMSEQMPLLEKVAATLDQIKGFLFREKQTGQATEELQAKIEIMNSKMQQLEEERQNLKMMLHEEEIRKFLVSSKRVHGEVLEKAVGFAKKLSPEQLDEFKGFILKLPELKTDARFTSGASIDEDDIKKQLADLEKYIPRI